MHVTGEGAAVVGGGDDHGWHAAAPEGDAAAAPLLGEEARKTRYEHHRTLGARAFS